MTRMHRISMVVMASLGALPAAAQIIAREPIVAPTLYTGPAPTGFRVTGSTPASVAFSWGASTGAVS